MVFFAGHRAEAGMPTVQYRRRQRRFEALSIIQGMSHGREIPKTHCVVFPSVLWDRIEKLSQYTISPSSIPSVTYID